MWNIMAIYFLLIVEQLMTKRKVSRDHYFKKKAVIETAFTFSVVMDGIEPPTQGFSVLCSTN